MDLTDLFPGSGGLVVGFSGLVVGGLVAGLTGQFAIGMKADQWPRAISRAVVRTWNDPYVRMFILMVTAVVVLRDFSPF